MPRAPGEDGHGAGERERVGPGAGGGPTPETTKPETTKPETAEPEPAEREIVRPETVEAARRGETESVRTLVEPELGRIYAVCHRMLGPGRNDEARDLAHDALVKIIRGLPGFDGRSSFGTWSTRVAMNACLSRLRAEARRAAAANGHRSIPAASREPGPGRGVQEDETRVRLSAAVAGLTPDHRAVLVLRDVRRLEYGQIGEVLGLSVGTVKSRLFRARAALRATLAEGDAEREPEDGATGRAGLNGSASGSASSSGRVAGSAAAHDERAGA